MAVRARGYNNMSEDNQNSLVDYDVSEERPNSTLKRILTIDGAYLDRLFTVGLFALFAVFLYKTPQYSSDSQMFPLAVSIPTFVLIVGLLLVQSSERLANVIEKHRSKDLFDMDDSFGDSSDQEKPSLPCQRKRVITISMWILLLFAAVYTLGFLPATFVFMLAFFKLEAELNWQRSVLYTVVVWSFIVVMFDVILNTPFYTGIFGIEIPTPG